MAKDCDQPRNPDTVVCRNCEKTGHFSRDCPEPKDWSKHKCSNCGQLGHGPKVSALYVVKRSQANIDSVARSRLPRAMAMPMAAAAVVAGAQMQVMPLVVVRLPGTLATVKLLGTLAAMEKPGRSILSMCYFSRHVW